MAVLLKKTFKFGLVGTRNLPVTVNRDGIFSVCIPKDLAKGIAMNDPDRKVRAKSLQGLEKKMERLGKLWMKKNAQNTKVIVFESVQDSSEASLFVRAGTYIKTEVVCGDESLSTRWEAVESRLPNNFYDGWGGFKFHEDKDVSIWIWSQELEDCLARFMGYFESLKEKLISLSGSGVSSDEFMAFVKSSIPDLGGGNE